MKKNYTSPAFMQDLFETDDIITVSPQMKFVKKTKTEAEAGMPEVDVEAEHFQE